MRLPEYQLDWVKIVDFYYWPISGPVIFFASVSTADQDKSCAINSHTDFSKQLKCMHLPRKRVIGILLVLFNRAWMHN